VTITASGVPVLDGEHTLMLRAPATAPASLLAQGPAEVVLTKDVSGTATFVVENVGGTKATGVMAWIDLPAGVTFEGTDALGPWTCTTPHGSNADVRCYLGTLTPGARVELPALILTNGNADGRLIRFWVEADGDLRADAPSPTVIRMASAAPTIEVALDAQTTFVQGVPRQFSTVVSNVGTTDATGLAMTVQLPAEVFWEGVPSNSEWTCPASVPGAGQEVLCTLSELAAGDSVEFAVSLRANGATQGRVIQTTLTADRGFSVSGQTTIVIGSLPMCLGTEWQKNTWYSKGTMVFYEDPSAAGYWNYERKISFVSIFTPSLFEAGWTRIGACVAP
jgi:hypothetical protein